MKEAESIIFEINSLLAAWESNLQKLPEDVIKLRRNSQNRSIKQILGHLIDSASNNTHRIVHLQYQQDPLVFPNYATFGNNDRWISIQNYQDENWSDLIQLWKYSHLHLCHVLKNVRDEHLGKEWISGPDKKITLRSMIFDYTRHLKLHLGEINDLIDLK